MPVQSTSKRCPRCGNFAPFHANKRRRDGLAVYCVACTKEIAAAYYLKNRSAIRERNARWYGENRIRALSTAKVWDENHREQRIQYSQRQRKAHPERYRAMAAVHQAVKVGKLTRGPCARCGSQGTEAHHHRGYAPEFYLDVIWLCKEHHEAAHHRR